MAKKTKELKPLRRFDYSLVSAQMDGLLFNVDRDLEKRDRWAFANNDLQREAELSLDCTICLSVPISLRYKAPLPTRRNIMARKLWSVAALLTIFAILGRFYAQPVLAQVRAALTQNVDEPGRAPFSLQRFVIGGVYTFNIPVGQRYVVDAYTADCETNPGTGIGDVAVLGVTNGAQIELTTPAHLSFATSGFAFYRGTSVGPLYADANSPLRIEAVPTTGNNASIQSCQFYITGHVIAIP